MNGGLQNSRKMLIFSQICAQNHKFSVEKLHCIKMKVSSYIGGLQAGYSEMLQLHSALAAGAKEGGSLVCCVYWPVFMLPSHHSSELSDNGFTDSRARTQLVKYHCFYINIIGVTLNKYLLCIDIVINVLFLCDFSRFSSTKQQDNRHQILNRQPCVLC